MLKGILKGAGTDALKYFPVRLVPALTSLITVPVFTNLIDRADYGDFALISSAAGLASIVATSWINGSIVRFFWTYDKQGRRDDYVGTTVWSLVATLATAALVLFAGVWIFRDSIPPSLLRLVPVGVASLVANHLVMSLLQVFRAANKASTYATYSVTSTLLGTGLSIFFVTVPRMGAFGILLGVVVGNALLVPFALRGVSKQGSIAPSHVRRDVVRDFVTYGFPLVPAAISSWLLVLADRYVIGFVQTSAEVGLYSVAYGLGEKIMQLVILPLTITMGPVMIQTFEQQGQKLAEQVQTQFTRYFSMVTFPLLFGMAAVARHFMGVFTGPEYRSAYPILAIVSAAAMFYGLVQIAGTGVALHKKTTITMTNTLAAAAFNIVANLLLVPVYGYMAAAYTTVAAYLLLLGLTWLRSRPYMAWHIPWLDLGRVLVASAIMAGAIVLAFSRFQASIWVLLAEVAVGIGVYAVALLAVGGLRADERAFARELAGKVAAKFRVRRP